MPRTKTISPEALATLRAGTVRDGLYFIPHQLSRPEYVAVKKVIEGAGGAWNRKAGGFIFTGAASIGSAAQLATQIESGEAVNLKQETQFFPTPPDVARDLAICADLKSGHKVLEPSAGRGALAVAAEMECPKIDLVLVEKDSHNTNRLAELIRARYVVWDMDAVGNAQLYHKDFMDCRPTHGWHRNFDRVIMNPPFTKGQDIAHILHAWEFLKCGGRLAAICCNGPKQNAMLKPWCESLGGTWEVLPAGTFKESGTMIETVMLTANA